jgi:hypothetical protein
MVGFKILSTPMETIELKKYPISSQTVLVGDLFELVAGATTWTATTATSNHFTRKVIAYEAASTSATEFLGYEVLGNETVEAQCANTAAAADNGDLMVLSDKNTVNNTHSTSTTEYACFMQDRPGSTTTSIIGKVLVGNGVNPDATT